MPAIRGALIAIVGQRASQDGLRFRYSCPPPRFISFTLHDDQVGGKVITGSGEAGNERARNTQFSCRPLHGETSAAVGEVIVSRESPLAASGLPRNGLALSSPQVLDQAQARYKGHKPDC